MSNRNARALGLEPEVIIGFVRSDPEPVVFAVPFAGDRAVTTANFYGINAAFLLKSKRRMPWIGFE
jgi:hypothetical protein